MGILCIEDTPLSDCAHTKNRNALNTQIRPRKTSRVYLIVKEVGDCRLKMICDYD